MRWKGFISLLVLLGIGCIISIFFMDQWIEKGIEKTGEAIVGAKVEMDRFYFNFFTLSVGWNHLQVTDPKNTMRNIIETGRTAFNMKSAALLRKRFIIEEITLADVRSGTRRSYDGALPEKKREVSEPGMLDKIKDHLQREIDRLPVMQFTSSDLIQKLNVDSLVQMVDLKLVDRVDSTKEDLVQTSDKWNRFLKDFHPEEDLKKVQDDMDTIDPKGIKTMQELIVALEKVQSVQKSMQNLKGTIDGAYQEVHDDFSRFSYYPQAIDRWVNEDYQRILQKAKLPDLSAQNIGKRLFGQEMVNRIHTMIDYYGIIQKIIPEKKEKTEKEKQPRFEGQTIYFTDQHGWPSFLIENLFVSGQTGASSDQPGFILQGEAKGITSQPWVYGKPTSVDLKGIREDQRSMGIYAFFDHTTLSARDSITFTLQHIPLQNMSIAETSYLPSRISRGWADVSGFARMENGHFDVEIKVHGRDVGFDFESFQVDTYLTQMIQKILAGVNEIIMEANLSFQNDATDFRLSSNLDRILSDELKKVSSEALAEAESRIRQRIDLLSQDRIADLNRLFNENQSRVLGPIDHYKNQSDNLKHVIDEKLQAIRDDINQRQKSETGELQEKAKNMLDELLKK